MNGQAFIQMMKQDIETNPQKAVLSSVVAVMEHVISLNGNCEIDGAKTADECYKKIYEYASKNKNGNCAVVTPEKSIEIVSEYLGLKVTTPVVEQPASRVSLEDFL